MSGNSNSEGAFGASLNRESHEKGMREFQHTLGTTPAVGRPGRLWELPELERLVAKYPDEARELLAELGGTDAPEGSSP